MKDSQKMFENLRRFAHVLFEIRNVSEGLAKPPMKNHRATLTISVETSCVSAPANLTYIKSQSFPANFSRSIRHWDAFIFLLLINNSFYARFPRVRLALVFFITSDSGQIINISPPKALNLRGCQHGACSLKIKRGNIIFYYTNASNTTRESITLKLLSTSQYVLSSC